MKAITDYITIAFFLYFFFSGWGKGFMKTLLAPLALTAGCIMGFMYYQKTHNLLGSLGICIIGPFIVNILASLILKLWHKAVDDSAPLSLFSQLSGSILNVLWGGSYLALMLALIAITPLRIGWFEKIRDDVRASKSYALIDQTLKELKPAAAFNVQKALNILQDPAKLQQFESTDEFKALRSDERLNELLSDEHTAEQIRNKDYRALLANPRMQEVFKDEALLNKIFALNKRIVEETIAEETTPEETAEPAAGPVAGSEPKTVDIQPK